MIANNRKGWTTVVHFSTSKTNFGQVIHFLFLLIKNNREIFNTSSKIMRKNENRRINYNYTERKKEEQQDKEEKISFIMMMMKE